MFTFKHASQTTSFLKSFTFKTSPLRRRFPDNRMVHYTLHPSPPPRPKPMSDWYYFIRYTLPLPLGLVATPALIYIFFWTKPDPRLQPFEFAKFPLIFTSVVTSNEGGVGVRDSETGDWKDETGQAKVNESAVFSFRLPDEHPVLLGERGVGTELDGRKSAVESKEKEIKKIEGIWHVMVKEPNIQVERPYTPIPAPPSQDEPEAILALLVKKSPKSETAGYIHSLKPMDWVEVRGPIQTQPVLPNGWLDSFENVVLISGGTGIAPFLQLLSSLPPPTPKSPSFTLIHTSSHLPIPLDLLPKPDRLRSLVISDLGGRRLLSQDVSSSLPMVLASESSAKKGWFSAEKKARKFSDEEKALVGRTLVLVSGPDGMIESLAGSRGPYSTQGAVGGLIGDVVSRNMKDGGNISVRSIGEDGADKADVVVGKFWNHPV